MSFDSQQPTTAGKLEEGKRGLKQAADKVANSSQVKGLTDAAKSTGKSFLNALGLGKNQPHKEQAGMEQGMGQGMGPAMGGKRRRKSRKRKSRRSKKRRTKRRRKSRRSKSRRRRRR